MMEVKAAVTKEMQTLLATPNSRTAMKRSFEEELDYDSCSSLTDSNPEAETDEEEDQSLSSHSKKRARTSSSSEDSESRALSTFCMPSEEICYEYCKMVLELFNSMDHRVASRFLKNFCSRRSIKLSCQFIDELPPRRGEEIVRHVFYGREQILDYLSLVNLFAPDQVVTMTGNPSFQLVENQALTVSIPCRITGTPLFDSNPVEMAQFLSEYHRRNAMMVQTNSFSCFQLIVPPVLTLKKATVESATPPFERMYKKVFAPALQLKSTSKNATIIIRIQHRGHFLSKDILEEENMASFYLDEICIKSSWI